MNAINNFGQIFSMLKQFDADGNGKITENDFILALRRFGLGGVGDYAARAAFRQVDKNRNGILDINEAVGLFSMLAGGHSGGGGSAGGLGGMMGGLGGLGGMGQPSYGQASGGGLGGLLGGIGNALGGMGAQSGLPGYPGAQGGYPGYPGAQGGYPGYPDAQGGYPGGGFF